MWSTTTGTFPPFSPDHGISLRVLQKVSQRQTFCKQWWSVYLVSCPDSLRVRDLDVMNHTKSWLLENLGLSWLLQYVINPKLRLTNRVESVNQILWLFGNQSGKRKPILLCDWLPKRDALNRALFLGTGNMGLFCTLMIARCLSQEKCCSVFNRISH